MLWTAIVPCVVLALVLLNLLTWPRDAGLVDIAARVSIAVPARDEEGGVEACVRAAVDVVGAVEVVVVDDGSSDGTAGILQRLSGELPRLRVVRNDAPLPAGWVGKPRACARLVDEAKGDAVLFVDADVQLAPDALRRLWALKERYGADLVTAVPRQETGTFFERLVVPLLHQTYMSWLPLPLIWRSGDPRFLAANGQIMLVEKSALARVGGFAAIRGEIVDDMALCRAAKRAGLRVLFVDGDSLGRCRMYRSTTEVVRGFSKNIHAGVGSVAGVVVAVALYLMAFVVPVVAAVVAPGVATVVAAVAAVAARAVVWVRFRQPLVALLLFPVSVIVLAVIALNSLRWTWRGRIEWKGRSYAPHSR